jgi:hypothetical protein
MGGRFGAIVVIAAALMGCTARNVPSAEPRDTIPNEPPAGTVVYLTDTTEWLAYVFETGVLVTDDYGVPEPYHIPTHDEAQVLRHVTYGPSGQRYLTDDGYTFGMPSASVTKAGTKTKYIVLGLFIRSTVIVVPF